MRISPLRLFFSGIWLSIPVASVLALVIFADTSVDDPLSNFARPLLWQAGNWLVYAASAIDSTPINTSLFGVGGAHLLGVLVRWVRFARARKTAALQAERTRTCPSCSVLIPIQTTLCRHCHAEVKRPYVDDLAGEHIQKLLSMHALGMTHREIAEFLNRNGELLLRDHSIWTARKIARLLARAKTVSKAA